jgi:soluble lytic murein transglycosylase-like protein
MNNIQQLIEHYAVVFGTDPNWIRAIITQESNFNPYALRYEPNYNYLVKPDYYANKLGISVETETVTQKMSFGLGQIMLALARDQHFIGYAGELFNPDTNIKQMGFLLQSLKPYATNEEDIFAMYNGGRGALHKVDGKYKNQAYVDSVKNHLKTLTA